MRITLRDSLRDPVLEVMNFLNEAVSRFPAAISFAPGRPAEAGFDVEGSLGWIGRFVDRRAASADLPRVRAFDALGQYGKTNGLIQAQLAEHLARDEKIEVPPESIMVTTGCQEAMLIALMGLFEPGRDVLLVSDPTYIGITGLAKILGIEVQPIACGEEGLDPFEVEAAILAVRARGLRPRAVYDIPSFNNPLGTCLSLAARHRLLEVARARDVLVLEDNPYGLFAYDGEAAATLKSLDTQGGVVVYLGSFAKTIFPGLRLGYLVADQEVEGDHAYLAQALARAKSLTTVNTSPLVQALAGGFLEAHQGSLQTLVEPKLDLYRANRDHMLEALERSFGAFELVPAVRWNRPAGGFFLTVTLPFAFDSECLEICARDYGVICCPMSFFALQPGREHQIRLSFSYVSPQQIDAGIEHLARFVAARMATKEGRWATG